MFCIVGVMLFCELLKTLMFCTLLLILMHGKLHTTLVTFVVMVYLSATTVVPICMPYKESMKKPITGFTSCEPLNSSSPTTTVAAILQRTFNP